MHRTNTLPLSLFSVCGLGRLRWIGNDLNSNTFLSTVSLRNLRIKLIANDLNSFLALSNDMSTRVPLSRSDRHGVFVKFFQVFARFRKKVFGYDADEEEDAIMVCPDLTFVAAGGCSQ